MDHVIKSLTVARILADAAPVPGLAGVVNVALRIAEMAKNVKDTRDECRLLAERAAQFSTALYYELNECDAGMNLMTTAQHVDALLSTLYEIEALMARRRKKRFLPFLLDQGKVTEEVKELGAKLDDALRVFNIQSSVYSQQQLSLLLHRQAHLIARADDTERVNSALLDRTRDIDSNVVDILHRVRVDATHDGTMRLYGRDEVELLEELDPEPARDGESQTEQLTRRFRARLYDSGRSVTVRRFPRMDDKFKAAVDMAKRIWHPNIVHAIGYSKPDPDTAFIVNGGVYTRTFNELSKSFRGIDKLLWTIKFSKQVYSGLMYLKSIRDDLGWTPDEDTYPIQADNELVVSADSRVLLDVGCYRLDRLPNTVIHDDGMVELHTRGRELVGGFKNPLEESSSERYAALCALWHKLVSFADFSRDENVIWGRRRIPAPGECFSLSQHQIIPGLEYEELVHHHSLSPTYGEPTFRTISAENTSLAATGHGPTVEHQLVYQKMIAHRQGHPGDARSERVIVRQPWRRYAVEGMDSGWYLEATTTMRENGDCRGWFMNEAVEFCHLPEDLEDLAIAHSLTFRTRTFISKALGPQAQKDGSPPTLYFYERVHVNALGSLDDRLDWPWGFWSTDPHDKIDILDARDVRGARRRKHQVAYLGISRDRELMWTQMLGHWIFQIRVQVEVECYRFTADECLVLREMERCASDEDRMSARFVEVADDDDNYDD